MANPRTIARLEARIKSRVAHCIQFELKDPRSAFVTLTRVELSTDLTHARVFWSTLGGEPERNRVAGMLADASGFVQRQLGRVLETRTIPRLRFVYDESIARAAQLDELISTARARDLEIRPEGDDEDQDAPTTEPPARE
ncbi:MAG: 30S ribosome-binding factor RbfA [Planctomycetota bacterium]|jgi:ribosome-binding factor A|nr:30S ribosome-binding factor RbfA [Planctomycetota bacterium]MDP6762393.1 30S ribosome-binding factor RbfA [Planctomycetota bacterium]MDP6990703.1 30S ribosome-binding factor RbfA [Planctomycetota bacterium]